MTHLFKTFAISSALALTLSACATYGDTDKDNAMMKKDEMSTTISDASAAMSTNPKVGGADMMADQTIVANASNAPNLTTLVSAVVQAELAETLSGPGPFTVFAPTNEAFAALPAATVNALMQDANRADLQKVLTAHVIAGKITSSDLMTQLAAGGGSYAAQTVSGDTITFYQMGDAIKISDENNSLATVTVADVMQSNGVVHVVNSVLVPK